MTDWRTRYRRESNALDNAVEARAVDSLLNYETIKLFATEEYEVGKYTEAIHAYQKADRKSQYTLGILNTTLNVVIQGGLALGCLLCAKRIAQKEMVVDDFVMYYAYIIQLYGPLNLFGTSYRSLQVTKYETDLVCYCCYARMRFGNLLISLMFYCIGHLSSIEKLYRHGKDARSLSGARRNSGSA
jgi:ABC-type transport system involved in Fe-S cluster assembly fused permease/ATPase subunit